MAPRDRDTSKTLPKKQTIPTKFQKMILWRLKSFATIATKDREELIINTAKETNDSHEIPKNDHPVATQKFCTCYKRLKHISQSGSFANLLYLWKRYVVRSLTEKDYAPWDIAHSNPEAYNTYQNALQMKQDGVGFPFFKPEVAVKFVYDDVKYPYDYAHLSGMELVNIGRKSHDHPTGIVHMPGMHVDEIGLTSEKYIPINATLTSLPLRISFDRSDMVDDKKRTTATAGGISPARWRLLSHLSTALEDQKQLGFEESDIDDLRRLPNSASVTLDLNMLLIFRRGTIISLKFARHFFDLRWGHRQQAVNRTCL